MAWWQDYFVNVDSRDIAKISGWFADDVKLKFGNGPVVDGKAGVVGALEAFLGQIKGINHKFGDVVESGKDIFLNSEVTYTRGDDRKVTIPAGTFIRRRDDKITDLRVFIDLAPLFAP